MELQGYPNNQGSYHSPAGIYPSVNFPDPFHVARNSPVLYILTPEKLYHHLLSTPGQPRENLAPKT